MEEDRGEEFEDDMYMYPEGKATLKIFPVEIWEQIFEHVEESADLQIFCKAFPFWDDVLHRSKQAWLFDQVFVHVWYYLNKREILGCRLVCKRWSNSVDRFLENNEYHRPGDKSVDYFRRRPLVRGLRDLGLLYSPYSLMRMERMYHVARTHPRNSIIGRSVYVDWERVPYSYVPFLNKFGKHIWYLRVQCTHRDIHPIPFLVRILEYLPHLPNLKKLELFLWEGQTQGGTIGASTDDLELYLRRYPVLNYPHLETLELEIMGHLHGKVKEVLMTTFSQQIRRLSINRFALWSHLPFLTDLSLTVDSNHQLECLLRLKSPLTRLALSIVDHANYPLTFKAIQHFAPSLGYLAIEFPTATSFSPLDWKQFKLPILNLPHLKTLSLKGCIPPSLNFISGVVSLQYLHIYDLRSSELVALLDNQTNFEEEILQILRYLNQPAEFTQSGCMYQSNVWQVLGQLKEFTFTSFIRRTPDKERCYRRDHYERALMLKQRN